MGNGLDHGSDQNKSCKTSGAASSAWYANPKDAIIAEEKIRLLRQDQKPAAISEQAHAHKVKTQANGLDTACGIVGESVTQTSMTSMGIMGDHLLSTQKSLSNFVDKTKHDPLHPIEKLSNLECEFLANAISKLGNRFAVQPTAYGHAFNNYVTQPNNEHAQELSNTLARVVNLPPVWAASVRLCLYPSKESLSNYKNEFLRYIHIPRPENSIAAFNQYLKDPSELKRINLSCTVAKETGPDIAATIETGVQFAGSLAVGITGRAVIREVIATKSGLAQLGQTAVGKVIQHPTVQEFKQNPVVRELSKGSFKSKHLIPKKPIAKSISDEKADSFSFTHVRSKENTPGSPDGIRQSISRLGNFRFERRTINKWDENKGAAVSSEELHRVYNVPGHKTKIVISDQHAKQIGEARNYYLTDKFKLHSGYNQSNYKVTTHRASELPKPKMTNQAKERFENSGWRVFPEGNDKQCAVLLPLADSSIFSTLKLQLNRIDAFVKFKNSARPEHIAAELAGFPNPDLVPEMRLCDHYCPDPDPGQSASQIQGFVDEATKVMEYYRQNNTFGFDDLTQISQHEFNHVFDYHYPGKDRGLYHWAVKIENALSDPEANLYDYGRTDVWENFAVHGEGLLSPDGREFARAINNERSCIRTAIFAKRLRTCLEAPGAELGLHRDEYLRRLNYIDKNVKPLAIQKLKDLRNGSGVRQLDKKSAYHLIQDLKKTSLVTK